ncbi:MAG: hypothetical protein ACRENS_12135 [Candidatus Eiseniibacteriota bacterium]
MFESLSDPVDVLSSCVDGRVEPLRFRWRGRVIRIARVTGRWQRREGQARLQYFSIEDRSQCSYELCYDPRGPKWILSRAWVDGSG